ncbi:hypothetical protein LZ30DRAFT_733637 [Colletotrichum cereale]|nr:hypothetical protein LZ30DRAFT_733637 [Colletotrichum cereale]
MRSFLLLLLVPVTVFSFDFTGYSTPELGNLCCDQGIADPSGTCKAMNLNAYGCSDIANDGRAVPGADGSRGGCDRVPQFPIGRNVLGFVEGSGNGTVKKPLGGNDNLVGFIGCAA